MTQANNVGQLTPFVNSSGQLSLTTGVTGTLPVANGGTGQTSFTSGYVHYGSFSTSSNFQYSSPTLYLLGPTAGTSVNLLNLYLVGTRAAGNQYGLVFTDSASETNAAIWAYQNGSGNNAAALIFGTNGGTGGAGGISSTTERMRIDSSGNVGIGGTPSYKLQVYGSGDIINVQSSGSNSFMRFTTLSSTGDWTMGVDNGAGTGNNSFIFYDRINSSYRMAISNAGALAFNGATNYGSSGQVLTSNGNAPPTWGAVSSLSGSAFSASTNGYYKVATSGMIIQWGLTGTIATSSTASVTFPIAFPNACFMAMNSMQVSSTANSYYASHTTPSTTGMTINSNGAIVAAQAWVAIGY